MMNFTCPVCGYPDLDEPAWIEDVPSFDICPCCGCTFGYEDSLPKAKLRFQLRWVAKGAPWFHPELKPRDWDLRQQLERIGLSLDDLNALAEVAVSHANVPEEKLARLRREANVAEARMKAFRFALEWDGDPDRIRKQIEGREEVKTSRTAALPNSWVVPIPAEEAYLDALREALAIVSDRPTSS